MDGRKSESKTAHVNVAALTPVAKAAEQPAPKATREVAHKVFPNPVQSEANITYTLAEDTKVNVAVYNVANLCLSKIVDGKQQPAGSYAYSYTPQAPGTYFVRFAFGDKVYVEQIVKK